MSIKTLLLINRDSIIDMVMQIIAKELGFELVAIRNFQRALNMLANRRKTNRQIDFLIVNGNMTGLGAFLSNLENININLPIHIVANDGFDLSKHSNNVRVVRKESLLSDCIKYLVAERATVINRSEREEE